MPSPKLPPHVRLVHNKVGKPFLYFQRGRGTKTPGRAVRLPAFDDPDFWTVYARLEGVGPPPSNTMAHLIRDWQASPQWAGMSPRTQALWRAICRDIATVLGACPVGLIEPKHIIQLQDLYAATPAKANTMLRCLRTMMSWSVPRGWRLDNPCREIKLLKAGDGYEPWTWDVIEAVRLELSPRRPDLWWTVALALYTGQRLSDVLAMRWNAINAGGLIAVRQGKTGKHLLIPLHRDLSAVLDTIPKQATTILTTAEGLPWGKGFQNVWAKFRPHVLKDRGLVFHGLRKSAVVTMLEAGCSEAEVAAVTGQSLAMVAHYGKQVNQAKLARVAIDKWQDK